MFNFPQCYLKTAKNQLTMTVIASEQIHNYFNTEKTSFESYKKRPHDFNLPRRESCEKRGHDFNLPHRKSCEKRPHDFKLPHVLRKAST